MSEHEYDLGAEAGRPIAEHHLRTNAPGDPPAAPADQPEHYRLGWEHAAAAAVPRIAAERRGEITELTLGSEEALYEVTAATGTRIRIDLRQHPATFVRLPRTDHELETSDLPGHTLRSIEVCQIGH